MATQSLRALRGPINYCRWRTLATATRQRLVLGIETSCDDTAAAVVSNSGEICGEAIRSQLRIHLNHGGVVPVVARDLHNAAINDVVREALSQSNVTIDQIDAVAVSNRPGLPLSLLVGINYARRLSLKYRKPLIPIHHMQAHALVPMLCNSNLHFPYLCLLLSGGHAQLAFVKSLDEFLLLGDSMDEAPGEVFDKIARKLKVKNLGEPFDRISGGEAIELLARKGNPTAYYNASSQIPLSGVRDCNFSFSGFRIFERLINQLEAKHPELAVDDVLPEIHDLAASLQYMMAIHIMKRLHRAIGFLQASRLLETVESSDEGSGFHRLQLAISGGVACNDYLAGCIQKMCQELKNESSILAKVFVPRPKHLCTDNGIMIAWNGMLKLLKEEQDPSHRYLIYEESELNQIDASNTAAIGPDWRAKVAEANIPPRKVKSTYFS